jgi:hypothetical protein
VTPVTAFRHIAALLGALVLGAGIAGCGSTGGGETHAPPSPPSQPQDFPSATGRSIGQLQSAYPAGPLLVAAVGDLQKGANRFGFALFDRARKQMAGADVALYTADATGGHVRGPYPVRSQSLAVATQFRSRTTASDPNAATSVYVAHIPFRRNGIAIVWALARLDGRLVATSALQVKVGAPGPPNVGQRAISVHTPTRTSVHGDLSKIDTRVPPDDMHDVDLAEVLGHKPVVLVFATPQLCMSRVCGPVVDEVEQVKSQIGDRAAFIHMEIYNGNDINKGYRPQVRAWRLPSEPWVFAVDRRGRIAARLEGPASAAEILAAAQRALH